MNAPFEIGVMQGRLSTPGQKVQSFPWDSWVEEFQHARECQFDLIEWLFDVEDFEQNPLWTAEGRATISGLISMTGVKVRSVCATYFMAHPFFRVDQHQRNRSIEVLLELISKASMLGISVVLLPVLEYSEIRTADEQRELIDSLTAPLALAQKHNIRIGLETELPALEYRHLISQGQTKSLGAYYDAGNATARGYDIADDVSVLGPVLCGIHLKDRKRAGKSFPLGLGDTNFPGLFEALDRIQYPGSLVLETPVLNDPIVAAQANLRFIKETLSVR